MFSLNLFLSLELLTVNCQKKWENRQGEKLLDVENKSNWKIQRHDFSENITPCFVHLRRMDDNLINNYLKKYGLKVKVASKKFEEEETHRASLFFWPGTISKNKKSRKRKREDRDDSSSKSRQKYSVKEMIADSCSSRKYLSKYETHKLNFSMKETTYLEHEESASGKFNQKKKIFLKAGSPTVKILEEKKRRVQKKKRAKNKYSIQISQSKIKNMMKELKKFPETQKEETGSSDAHFSEQCLKNVRKTFSIIHTCRNKINDNNNNAISVIEGKQVKEGDEKCSQFDEVIESEANIMRKVSQTEKNDELCTIGGRYSSAVCDSHLDRNARNETLNINQLSLDEEEYDSRGEDSEDDKQTVIFEEKFDTLEKLKESSGKVSKCKQQNVKNNVKGEKLKSPRTFKRRKPSLMRIIKKEKILVRKKLEKTTRKIEREDTKRCQIKKSRETITRNDKFVEKFEDVLAEISHLVKHLHDTHKIIIHLKKDMEENEKLAEHFKTVIEAQQENYRKEIWKNQETIMRGYDKMMSFCKKSSTVSLEISNRTLLSIEDVENVLSRCILVENALEMLRCTQKLSTVEKNVFSKETQDQGMRASFEKEQFIETAVTSGDNSKSIGTELQDQIIILNECQDQLTSKRAPRKSKSLYLNDSAITLANHLAFPSSTCSVPCTISTLVLKEEQVMPPMQGYGEHSDGVVLDQSLESNHIRISYSESSKKSQVNIINQDHQRNSIAMATVSSENGRSEFNQYGTLQKEDIQPKNNVQNQLLIRPMGHSLHQQHLTKNLSQFLTSGSVQQIHTTKRPPRPQNPVPRVFQPEVEMNSKRDKQQYHQQAYFIHRPSAQKRINIEPNFTVPFNPAASGSFDQSQFTYSPHLMKSNSNKFNLYAPFQGISKPLSSRNNMRNASHLMSAQKGLLNDLPQFNTTISNVSNTNFMFTLTPARSRTSQIPVLPRQLLNPPTFSQNTSSCRIAGEPEPDLRLSNSTENIPTSIRALHPVPQFSNSLNAAAAEQRYVNKANEQVLRENKSSARWGSCTVLTSSALQKSKSEPQLLDPTIPQKLTMKNQRLQAGAVLKSSAEVVTKSKSQPDRVIKIESVDIQEQEKVPETQKISRGNSSRKYECAQNGCKNLGTRICKGCESVIYCSGTCQLIHWKRKHKEECTKLRELRG